MRLDKPRSNIYFSNHYDDTFCFSKLVSSITTLLLDLNKNGEREIVFICIGTDRATGDCLGPLVGTRLNTLKPSANIYGTLQHPVHAINFEQSMNRINKNFHNPFIIAVDACLGTAERVGFININKGSLFPGSALKKELPGVGDFYISGVVNIAGFFESLILQSTRLYHVDKMAEVIAKSLCMAYYNYCRIRKTTLS